MSRQLKNWLCLCLMVPFFFSSLTICLAEDKPPLPAAAVAIKQNAERFRSGTLRITGITTISEPIKNEDFKQIVKGTFVREQTKWEDEYIMALDLEKGFRRLSHRRYLLNQDGTRADKPPEERLFIQNDEMSVIRRSDSLVTATIYPPAPLSKLAKSELPFRSVQVIDLRLIGWAGLDFLALPFEEAYDAYFLRHSRTIKEEKEGDLYRLEVWNHIRDQRYSRFVWWCDPQQGFQPIRAIYEDITLNSDGEIVAQNPPAEEIRTTWSQVGEVWLPRSISHTFRRYLKIETEFSGTWSDINEPVSSKTFSIDHWKHPADYFFLTDSRLGDDLLIDVAERRGAPYELKLPERLELASPPQGLSQQFLLILLNVLFLSAAFTWIFCRAKPTKPTAGEQ